MSYKYIKVGLLVYFGFSIQQVKSQSIHLSSGSTISLLTCGAGDELYTSFGHSALHVNDDSLGIDLVFNYGTFDFDTPNFYLKFVNGELDYMLSVNDYSRFRTIYDREQRSVSEHVLQLSQAEKEDVWHRLVTNYQPQNRFYLYDFFFDNCATRIRDLLFAAKGIEKEAYSTPTDLSFRDYLHIAIGSEAWESQGIDLILGNKTDRLATVYERAFLPVYLDSLLIDAGLINASIHEKYTNDVYKYTEINSSKYTTKDTISKSWLYVSILAVFSGLLLSYREYRKHKHFKGFDVVLFSMVSLLAILFCYAWLFTSHVVMRPNMNVFWASLLYIPLIYAISANRTRLTKGLAYANLASIGLFVLLSILRVQSFPYIVYPLVALLALRNYRLTRL